MGINNPQPHVGFHAIVPALTAILAGAAGWIDTDVSATTGTDTARVWVIVDWSSAPSTIGARAHGSAVAAEVFVSASATLFSHVDAAGHIDYYRDAGNNNQYLIMGYLE
jgi:hypothetical protein